MKEAVLKHFFEGTVSAEELDAEMATAFRRQGRDTWRMVVEEIEVPFDLRTQHLMKLCDAVVQERLDPRALEAIGFAVITSDQFRWTAEPPEGKRIGEVLHDWSAPEINRDLTIENVRRWRRYLTTGEPVLGKRTKSESKIVDEPTEPTNE